MKVTIACPGARPGRRCHNASSMPAMDDLRRLIVTASLILCSTKLIHQAEYLPWQVLRQLCDEHERKPPFAAALSDTGYLLEEVRHGGESFFG